MAFQRMLAALCALGLFDLTLSLSEEPQDVTAPAISVQTHIRSIPLQKQYVPVKKDSKVVAYKTAYFGKIQAGTPAQDFTVVFDTGSGHLVLPQSSCLSTACAKHRRFDRFKSESAVDIEHTGNPINPNAKDRDQVVVSYGTGKVTGEFVHDIVCMGNDLSSCVKMRVVLATDMTDDPFGLFEFDGVMGLGLDSLRLDPKFSFFGEMVAQSPSMSPQFSVFLSRHEGGESQISFGGYDTSLVASEVQWLPVAKPELGHWQVQIKQVRIGSTVLDECTDGTCHAVFDTGTSLLGAPRMAVRSMHRLLARVAPTDGVSPSEIDCRQVPGHAIDFDFGDATVSLPVEDYSRPAPINMTSQESGKSSLVCRSLLLPIDLQAPLGPKVFIFGEPVLRRYLTVYDLAQKRIGFSLAQQRDPSSNGQQSSSIGAPLEGSLLAGAPLPSAGSAPSAVVNV